MKKAIIICGFPGVGKSCVANNRKNILDAESSAFSWIWNPENIEKGRERNPEFPSNYIRYIKENMERYDVILVSSHDVVRDALKAEGVDYIIVLPTIFEKNEYMRRYLQRGSGYDFIAMMDKKWVDFTESIMDDDAPKIWIGGGEYMADVLGVIAR